MTDTDHDPAEIVAEFLADGLPAEDRRSIEAHIMSCNACWSEMTSARAGRTLAESLREPAPQSAREMLRSIAANPLPDPVAEGQRAWRGLPRRRAVPWLHLGVTGGQRVAAAAVLVVVAALTGIVSLLSAGPPDGGPLQAAAAEYQVVSGGSADSGEHPPAEHIGDLIWTETIHKSIGGQQATLYRYADSGGRRLVLISSAQNFPRASNAQAVGSGPEWMADIDGATLLCADNDGLSWLVVAGSKDEALAAGDAVGLPI